MIVGGTSVDYCFQAVPEKTGGILSVGPVAFSINNENLRALVNAVEDIEEARETDPSLLAQAKNHLLSGTEWGPIGYIPSRESYNFRYRGVVWEAPVGVVIGAVGIVKRYLASMDDYPGSLDG